MHVFRAFAFIRMNDMAVQQVVRIEYSLLKYINLVRVSGVEVRIEFVPGQAWKTFRFTSGTGSFIEKSKLSDAGISYTREVKCNVAMDDVETLSEINKLEHADIVVRVMYNSGEWKVIGVPGDPARVSAQLEVGKSGLYKVSFLGESIYRACFLKP